MDVVVVLLLLLLLREENPSVVITCHEYHSTVPMYGMYQKRQWAAIICTCGLNYQRFVVHPPS